jgi:hypothetical protein
MAETNLDYGNTDCVPDTSDEREAATELDSRPGSPIQVDDHLEQECLQSEDLDWRRGQIALEECPLPKPAESQQPEGQVSQANPQQATRKRKSQTRHSQDRSKFRRTNSVAKSHIEPAIEETIHVELPALSRPGATNETEFSSEFEVCLILSDRNLLTRVIDHGKCSLLGC